MSRALFDELELPVKRKTKKGEPSVDKYALDSLCSYHFLPNLILEFRSLNTLKNNFVDKLLEMEINGFVFSTFNLVGTVTGRFSSSKINLQQIPKIKTDAIRKLFLPKDEGNVLVRADYSQMELRMVAHLSLDKKVLVLIFLKWL